MVPSWADAVVAGAMGVATAVLLVNNATQRFCFMDFSAYYDTAWRILSGQRLYEDFLYHAGPVHPWLYVLFWKVFGPGKAGILWHLAIGGALGTVLHYALARRRLGAMTSILVAAVASWAFYGPMSHPWYDQNAMLFLLAGLLVIDRWPGRAAAASAGALAAVAFFTKANVGAVGAALLLCRLAWDGQRLQKIGAFAGGGILVAVAVGCLVDPAGFWRVTFGAQAPVERLIDVQRIERTLRYSPLWHQALALVAVIATHGRSSPMDRRALSLAVATLGMGFLTTWTSSIWFSANLVCLSLFLVLLLELARTAERSHARIVAVAYGIALLPLAVSKTVNMEGLAWYKELVDADTALTLPGFEGWMAHGQTSRGFEAMVGQVDAVVPPSDTILVVPDSTILYAVTGHDSYRKAPVSFRVGNLLVGEAYDAFQHELDLRPPAWIIVHDTEWHTVRTMRTTAVLAWLHLDERLERDYELIRREGEYHLFRRRAPVSASDRTHPPAPEASTAPP